jgi:RNA polymerase sigma-70 factor, ECF subfamily
MQPLRKFHKKFYYFYSTHPFCIFETNPIGKSEKMTFIALNSKASKYSSLPDEALLEQFRSSHDMEIIGEFYRRYAHLVLGVCIKYLKKQESAHDAAMQIFEKLIADLKTNRIENFKSWLYTVSKNYCLSEIRKETSTHRLLGKIEENSGEKFVEIWEELHLHNMEEEKRLAALTQALTQLNHEQRTCVQLIYLEDKSYKEIADITGMDINHIKSHIQNGKRNLKLLLEKIK